jgi:hypothetical protein
MSVHVRQVFGCSTPPPEALIHPLSRTATQQQVSYCQRPLRAPSRVVGQSARRKTVIRSISTCCVPGAGVRGPDHVGLGLTLIMLSELS